MPLTRGIGMIWESLCKKYLGAFAVKDLDALNEFYAEDIHLKDWSYDIYGKERVLRANRDFFKRCDQINIAIKNSCYRDKLICIEFDLILIKKVHHLHGANQDFKSIINVVDLIELNSQGQIKSIRAYKN
jgi:hypothetical protein